MGYLTLETSKLMDKIQNKIGWLIYDEASKRILLHRRDHCAKESPDVWDCFGGQIENEETEYEAFLRELCEELGITAEKEKVWKLNNRNYAFYCAPYRDIMGSATIF